MKGTKRLENQCLWTVQKLDRPGSTTKSCHPGFDWGVKVPLEEARRKSSCTYGLMHLLVILVQQRMGCKTGKDWKPYWKDKETKLVHFIGKDNIVFHCIIFPAMLKHEGLYFAENVPANEFMNLEGDKMSTSRNWKLTWAADDFVKKENGGGQAGRYVTLLLNTILLKQKTVSLRGKVSRML